MSAAPKPISDPREQRQRLEDLDALLERLLNLPLPTRPVQHASPLLQVVPAESRDAADEPHTDPIEEHHPSTPAENKVERVASGSKVDDLPEGAQTSDEPKSLAVTEMPGKDLSPVSFTPAVPTQGAATLESESVPLPAPARIPSIPKSRTVSEPERSLALRGLEALDAVASRPLTWFGLEWLRPVLGWIGLILLGGAAALAIGSWLGLQARL